MKQQPRVDDDEKQCHQNRGGEFALCQGRTTVKDFHRKGVYPDGIPVSKQ